MEIEAADMPDELWAGVMAQIEEAGSKNMCSHLFIADGTDLVNFCRDAVVVLRSFRAKVGDYDVFDPPVNKSMHAALSEVENFLRSKNKSNAMINAFFVFFGYQVEADPRTFSGMKNQVTEAILLHAELVLRAVKKSQESCLKRGAPLKLREKNSDAVKVLSAVQEIDDVIYLASEVEKRYGGGERSEINDLIVKIVGNTNTQKQLCRMVEDVQKTVRAMHADEWCPRVFFIVPPENTGWWTVERFENMSLWKKKARIFFMCRMMWEDLQACGKEPQEGFPPVPGHELSKPLDISIPRDFLKKRGWVLAIKLSLQMVNFLAHAAAFGLDPLGSIISGLASVAEDATFENLWNAIDEAAPPTESEGEAHVAMRDYLRKKHEAEWRSAVRHNLIAVYNQNDARAYVCKENDTHKDAWRSRSMP